MEIIFGIPGPWNSLEHLVDSQPDLSDRQFSIIASALVHITTGSEFWIDFCGPDERVTDGFLQPALCRGISDGDADRVRGHKSIVYLGCPGGSVDTAKTAIHAACAILDCGGYAISVETSGVRHSPANFRAYAEDARRNLIAAYVLYVIGDEGTGEWYSCGMHNFGMRDVVVSLEDLDEAYSATEAFLYMLYVDRPDLLSGQTFSEGVGTDVFLITDRKNQPCEGLEGYENPYGVWELSLYQKRRARS